MKILIPGGAGFVGSSVALGLKARHPDWEIISLDNLKRRGSELALPRLRAGGVQFIHGDVRIADDLRPTGACDLLIDCSAEPSVLAGRDGATDYVLQTNLGGTIHCLDHARRHGSAFIFLSTSRVYPMAPLTALPLEEAESRFELPAGLQLPGMTARGLSESFPMGGARSLYGATKFASEVLIHEYVEAWGLRAVINRCGVLTGPWQMGKVDQGVVVHWAASHLFDRPLRYIGYGGTGKQVRDMLHVADLVELLDLQIPTLGSARGEVFNVGGGREVSFSLRELTEHCVRATGRRVAIDSVAETRAADVPIYLTDNSLVESRFPWKPRRGVGQTIDEIVAWLRANEGPVRDSLGF